jgi:TolB protein
MTTLALIATATVAATINLTPTAYAEPDNAPIMAAHGVEAPREAVPWSQVGPGWMLAMWSPAPGLFPGESPPPGSPTRETATTTLYLVDPAGGRYAITTFPPPGDGDSPRLADWSGDGTRALFSTEEKGQTVITEVDLRSGTNTTFTVDRTRAGTPRYTRPDGKAVLLYRWKASEAGSLERVDLAGNHQLTYPVGPHFQGYLSTPDGTRLVLGTASGLALMSNDGVAGKALPIAGQKDCTPLRWWDTGSMTALTSCEKSGKSQLWLVPIDSGTPTALTAPIDGHGPDYGDLNAWQLPAGTYLQAAGACGVVYLAKLNADGTTARVSVPDVKSGSVVVLGVNGGDLDLKARAGCGGGQALIDYNLAAGTSTVLLGPPVNGGGVIDAVPYPGQK